ncbi:two-component system response regulator BtsR [Consotaella aegiceratis]|uniref:two-component system response regulator BtsR n=1 Tax=Consotaella aegiceratis TaxID=3097961 RepID=UPI002F423DBF
MIRALIVDDEPHARQELASLLGEHDDVEVVAQCGNAIEALRAINHEKPQVVFLDIHMPRISGMEMVGMLDPETMPRIVFVTAHDEYAVAAFEENASDYLLKPLETGRLSKTLTRIRESCGKPAPMSDAVLMPLVQIPCFAGNRIKLIPVQEVEYVYSDPSGVHVVSTEGEAYTDMTLAALEQRSDMVRCHRQCLVRLARVREIRLLDNGLGEILTHGGKTVAVSRRHLRDLRERIGLR